MILNTIWFPSDPLDAASAPMLTMPSLPLPQGMHAAVLARVFNHLMRGQSLPERLGELEGKRIRLHVRDLQLELQFRITANGLRSDPQGEPDVTIRGELGDFWRLAARREDPDTLFFHRRLCVEGETECGLRLKNLLDALEYDWKAHVRAVLPAPLAALAVLCGEELRILRGDRPGTRAI